MASIKRCTNIVGSVATFQDVAIAGSVGPGVPPGGATSQILAKINATDYNTQWVTPGAASVADGSITNVKLATMTTLTMKGNATGATAAPTDLSVAAVKTMLALDQVTNTTDANKPVSTAQQTALDTKAPLRYTAVTTVPGTTRTLLLTDEGQLILYSSATAVTLTIPPNSTTAFGIGVKLDFAAVGAGKLTVAYTTPVTVVYTPALSLRAQGSAGSLIKTGTDSWLLTGDLG